MRRTTLLLLPLAVAMAVPGHADTVRLKNGRAYEGVIADRTPGGVRIQLAFGQLVIPNEQVVAVDKAPSALAVLLARQAVLEARADATAAEWLELARWAKRNDLATAAHHAALAAAELDPRLPGLDAMLRPFGLVFEESLARWIPLEESMARHGMVRYDGEWMTIAEQRDRAAERDRRRAAEAQEEASRRLAAAADAMRRGEELRTLREAQQYEAAQYESAMRAQSYLPVLTFPGYWVPPVVVVVRPPRRPDQPDQPMQARSPHGVAIPQPRIPGSFLPLESVTEPAAPGTMSAGSRGGR